jgi:hypothetical protein
LPVGELRRREARPSANSQTVTRREHGYLVFVGERTGQNLLDECFVVDHSLAVFNSLHHLIDLVSTQALAESEEDVPQLGAEDLARFLLVEHLQAFQEIGETTLLLLLGQLFVDGEPFLESYPLLA